VEVATSSGRDAPVRLLGTGAALLLVFMIALASSPSGASASRVSVSVRERPGLVKSYLRFDASRGEENHVVLRRVAGRSRHALRGDSIRAHRARRQRGRSGGRAPGSA